MEKMASSNSVHSMYVHIPFCDSICTYCDFCKMLYNKKMVDRYLEAMDRELSSVYKNEVLDTLYIGGGTPSSLNLLELERLFSILKRVKLSKNYEFTFEANLESLSLEKIDLLKKYGVNRVSIGVESTNRKHLITLNRTMDEKKLVSTINYLKEVGITNINVDLIYALLNETLSDLESDIDFILSLDVSHISTYSLILEENTLMYIKGVKNVDSSLDADMYKLICEKLKMNGYIHYEISNFCKEGYQSMHNLTYWMNDRYYGIGLGSSGYLEDIRYTNTRSINDYCREKFILEQTELNTNDDIFNEVMLGLRTSYGIDKKRFYNKYHKKIEDVFDIDDLILNKILISSDKNLRVSEEYFYVLNSVLVNILERTKEILE